MLLLFFLICFFASAFGGICGIGGGIIIKPLLDAFGVLDASAISFLSGCTVLSMTTYSVLKSRFGGKSHVDHKISVPLAVGAAAGGIAGKNMMTAVLGLFGDERKLGLIQAVCMLVVTVFTLVYTVRKERVKTLNIRNFAVCVLLGFVLGMLSSFLGIGGGPLNLVVLFYFFSMPTKSAAENSLYIIFFSQCTNLVTGLVSGSIPDFDKTVLCVMILGGIFGGIAGRFLNGRLKEKTVDRLFILVMAMMILIGVYNILKFA